MERKDLLAKNVNIFKVPAVLLLSTPAHTQHLAREFSVCTPKPTVAVVAAAVVVAAAATQNHKFIWCEGHLFSAVFVPACYTRFFFCGGTPVFTASGALF